jgi:hypothetical protein
MCSAGKSHVCFEEVYFGSCTDRFLYLVHFGFTSYCIIIMSCNSNFIILIFLNIIDVVQNLVFHGFSYSPLLLVFLLSALLISARHVAAYY